MGLSVVGAWQRIAQLSDRSYLANSALGQPSEYRDQLDSSLLFPIARKQARSELALSDWPYYGADIWYVYELSWLAPSGLPQVALARLTLPANSPHLIESKSLKLYINSYAMTRFANSDAVQAQLAQDLSAAAGAPVLVALFDADMGLWQPRQSEWLCLDALPISASEYQVNPGLLALYANAEVVSQTLYSHLLRSNCPVTGQPDWGTVVVSYEGPQIDHSALLRYIVSYRTHTGFHEQCVERIFMDLMTLADFSVLRVQAHYLRRGGLDINPWRALSDEAPDMGRWPRQ